MKQTSHGKQRMQDPDRPSAYAQQDRLNPKEVYIDNETNYLVYVGPSGRTHITKFHKQTIYFRFPQSAQRIHRENSVLLCVLCVSVVKSYGL